MAFKHSKAGKVGRSSKLGSIRSPRASSQSIREYTSKLRRDGISRTYIVVAAGDADVTIEGTVSSPQRVNVPDPGKLGFKNVHDMLQQLVNKEAAEQEFREARIAAQREGLRSRNFDLSNLAEITTNERTHSRRQAV